MRGPLPAGALGARRAFDVSPALRHSLGTPQFPSFPPLNLHKAASAAITAGFLHVAVSKAHTLRATERFLPTRASDTALEQIGSCDGFTLNGCLTATRRVCYSDYNHRQVGNDIVMCSNAPWCGQGG